MSTKELVLPCLPHHLSLLSCEGHVHSLALSPGQDMHLWMKGRSDLCSSLFNVSFELHGSKINSEANPSLTFKSVLMRLFQLYHGLK